MTSLEDFLNKKDVNYQKNILSEVDGTFVCQDIFCEEIVLTGLMDVDKNKIYWYCSKDHESSLVL